MTNAEKFLKDGVDIENFINSLCGFVENWELRNDIKNFLKKKVKPTLTEDERVILRNLRYEKGAYEYTKIGRTDLDSEGRCDLILIDSDNESVWWGEYGHLFQFIKERRRILYRGTVERRIEMKRTIKLAMVFKEGTEKENTFGTDEIAYEIWYFYETGIMEIDEIGSFGDRRLVGEFKDKTHSREMLDILLEIADMDYETFKSKVLDKCETGKNIV